MTRAGARARGGEARPAAALLAWYDVHARTLPWRLSPRDRSRGRTPDPWAVLLSEVMLQQTTVAAVAPRYRAFLERWPTPSALADAPVEALLSEWAGLGYYARARNLHKCAAAIAGLCGGEVPDTEEALLALPGIGPYTAAAVAAIAFDRPAVVVDGNVERVVARLFRIEAPLPDAKPEIRARAGEIRPRRRPGDFWQAMMDLGALVCTPRAPKCGRCPVAAVCRSRGDAEAYPRRKAKAARPVRYGWALAAFGRDGRVLLERRPDKGLLGGTLGLPGSAWIGDRDSLPPPPEGARRAGAVAHVFTHFRLELEVWRADAALRAAPAGGSYADPETVRIPTVMRKALDAARRAAGGEPAGGSAAGGARGRRAPPLDP